MEFEIIKNDREFLALKPDWDRLSTDRHIINGFEWNYTWWKCNSHGRELNIVVMKDDKNIVVGIAPLCIEYEKTLKFFKTRTLAFIGGKVSDYRDFLIDKSNKSHYFKELWNYVINQIPCDSIEFTQINTFYANFDEWKALSALSNITFEENMECRRIKLSNYRSYEDYFETLKPKHQRNVKRCMNKIEREFTDHEFVIKNNITEEEFEEVAKININRQKTLFEKGNTTRFCYFMNTGSYNFMKEFFCNDPGNSKSLAYIRCDGEMIAYMLNMSDGVCFSCWNGTLNPDYEKYSPFKLLVNHLIRHAFENNYKYFDFMRGRDTYKLEWIDDFTYNFTLKADKSLASRLVKVYKGPIRQTLAGVLRLKEKKIYTS